MDSVIESQQIREDVRELRQQVSALRAALAERDLLGLRPDRSDPFLGQPVVIEARLSDASGAPRAGVPVTFVTSWGRLRHSRAFTARQGNTVTALTSSDGTIRLELLPAGAEELSRRQEDALIALLARLDPQAETPQQAASGLQEIVRHYLWDSNPHLRPAVDILFQQLRSGIVDTVNRRDPTREWAYIEATLTAFVQPASRQGGPVQAMALLSLRFKDWLAPWLENFRRLEQQQSGLEQLFEAEKRAGRQTGQILDGLYRGVHQFVEAKPGIVGRLVGQQVAESSLREIARNSIDDLPPDQGRQLFTGLRAASRTLSQAGAEVLAGLGQVRSEARTESRNLIQRIDVSSLPSLNSRLQGLESDLAGKAGAEELEGLRQSLRSDLEGKASLSDLDSRLAVQGQQFEGRFEALDQSSRSLQTAQQAVRRDLEGLQAGLQSKADSSQLQRVDQDLRGLLDAKASTIDLNRFRSQLQRGINAKADLAALEAIGESTAEALSAKADASELQRVDEEIQAVQQSKANQAALNNVRRQLLQGINAKADQSALNEFREATEESLKAKADADQLRQQSQEIRSLINAKADSNALTQLEQRVQSNFQAVARELPQFRPVIGTIFRPPGRGD